MSNITIYTTSWCPSCVKAKVFFEAKGAAYTEVDVEQWEDPRGRLEELTGRRSVPQIVIGDAHVGGFDDLLALHHDGAVDELLKAIA